MMRVVSGALLQEGKVLMGFRKAMGYRPNLWELPGGKIDGDETPQQALAREWFEEIGVIVEVGRFVSVAMLNFDSICVIELYQVTLAKGDQALRAKDHQRLAWVEPSHAMKWLPCSPAFYSHYPQLVALAGSTRTLSGCDSVGDLGCVNAACLYCHPTQLLFLEQFQKDML